MFWKRFMSSLFCCHLSRHWATQQLQQSLTPLRRPTRHISTDRKIKIWNLIIKKHLILGHSNVSRFSPFTVPDLQINSFLGATFRHMLRVLINSNPEVQMVFMSLGINNRKQILQTAITEIQKLYRKNQNKFLNAEILFPLINFAKSLPFRGQEFLYGLNRDLKLKYSCLLELPLKFKYSCLLELPRAEFPTEPDAIHWTHDTSKRVLQHWIQQGN